MALYDHRVFRADDKWWVAQVHSGSGAGAGVTPRISSETAIFTCLTDAEANSRRASIRAGSLNRLRHSAIKSLLERATPVETRFDMWPYNTPNEDELGAPALVDDEGLKWVVRPSRVVRLEGGRAVEKQALEFICLDDSALRKEVSEAQDFTLEAFRARHGDAGLKAVVQTIKGTFIER